jgi:hypothetical protein
MVAMKKPGPKRGGQASDGCDAGGRAHRPDNSITANRQHRRLVRLEVWATLHAAVVKQWNALPPDSPRVRPTLPALRFMRAEIGGAP